MCVSLCKKNKQNKKISGDKEDHYETMRLIDLYKNEASLHHSAPVPEIKEGSKTRKKEKEKENNEQGSPLSDWQSRLHASQSTWCSRSGRNRGGTAK